MIISLKNIFKDLLTVLILSTVLILLFISKTALKPVNKPPQKSKTIHIGNEFVLNDKDIEKNTDTAKAAGPTAVETAEKQHHSPTKTELKRQEVLARAKAMAEVKWIPKHTILGWKHSYVFRAGKTYIGIPYSMGDYQVQTVSDFQSHIKTDSKLYGNDCSCFVSNAWGLSRQTTVSFFDAVNSGEKIDNQSIEKISWTDVQPGDALLREDGTGKGHIMLYIRSDNKNPDRLYVYEQNMATTVPYEPIPTAREDARSKKSLLHEGYFPIRLKSLK